MSLRDRIREVVTREDDGLTESQRRHRNELTKLGLAQARARGVTLGRPSGISPELRARILEMRRSGMTLQAIADTLNSEGVATTQGGRKWYASTVAAVIKGSA